MSGLTIRAGVTRRSLIATKVNILIFTPEASAEIHSITGKKLKKTLSTIMAITTMSSIPTNDESNIQRISS
ncbi:hypothetical protein D3C85_1393620 [compost metagenome]